MVVRHGIIGMGVAVSAVLFVSGCGSNSLEKGDLLVTTQEIRVEGESVWEDGTTEAFTRDVPPRTVFRVLYPQRPGLDIIEVEPVVVGGRQDPDYITNFFLPPHLRGRFGFKSFSLTLDVSDFGTKYRRVSKKKGEKAESEGSE